MIIVPNNVILPQRPQSTQPNAGGTAAYAPRLPQMGEKEIAALQRVKETANTAKTVLSGLQNSTAELREAKKQDALRRFDELQKRMVALKKAFGGDPKFLAKTLNAIAKELKSVVKDYKDAIGDKPSLTPNIQSRAMDQAQLVEDEVKSIEKSEMFGKDAALKANDANIDETTKNVPKDTTIPKEAMEKYANTKALILAENEDETDVPKTPPLDAIRAYVQSLMTDEHGKFMREVRRMSDDIKHYAGLFKAQIKFAGNDKDGDKIIKEGDDALKELFDETVNLQAKLNSPEMAVGNLVSVKA